MRQVTTTIYKWDELSDESQRSALEQLYELNMHHDWHEHILDNWREQLEDQGLGNVDIEYSGFNSQGDGASFTASVDDIRRFMNRQDLSARFDALTEHDDIVDASIERVRYANYVHSNTIGADVSLHGYLADDVTPKQYDKICEQAQEFENYLDEWARDTSDKIYRDLEREYDYVTSEEAIIETIRANEYEFCSDGSMA